jgi:hypothetical protein
LSDPIKNIAIFENFVIVVTEPDPDSDWEQNVIAYNENSSEEWVIQEHPPKYKNHMGNRVERIKTTDGGLYGVTKIGFRLAIDPETGEITDGKMTN